MPDEYFKNKDKKIHKNNTNKKKQNKKKKAKIK